MPLWLLIPALVLALAALLVLLLAWGQFGQARRIERAYAGQTGDPVALVEPAAKMLGLASEKPSPQGDGVLLLSDTEVYFERFHPPAAWRLGLDRVLKLEMPEEFAGARRAGRRFMVLVFHDEHGKTDRVGFRVAHVDRWLQETGRRARICQGISTEGGCR